MTYDYSKLLGRITEKIGTQGRFADAVGLSERTISLKLNGKVGWKQPEIAKVCEVLDIDTKDISTYFFVLKVQRSCTKSVGSENNNQDSA